MSATVVDAALVADGKASVLDLLVAAGLAPSKGRCTAPGAAGTAAFPWTAKKVTDVSAVVNADSRWEKKAFVIKTDARLSITVLHCNRNLLGVKKQAGMLRSEPGGPGLFFTYRPFMRQMPDAAHSARCPHFPRVQAEKYPDRTS